MSRVTKMREQIRRICSACGIKRRWCRHADLARVEGGGGRVPTIWIPPIRGVVEYAAALHELGHIFGRFQHPRYSEATREFLALGMGSQNHARVDAGDVSRRLARDRRSLRPPRRARFP
jgi:hypothetical protein